jgi:hypothetical protein
MCSGIISHRIQLFLQQRGMPQPFRFGKGFCFRSPLVNVYSMIIVKRHRCMNRCQRQLILARNLCQRLPLLQGHERNICHRDSGSHLILILRNNTGDVAMKANSLRKQIFTLHRYLGLAIALIVIIVGLTGSLLVFRSEISHAAIEHNMGKVVSQGEILSVETILDIDPTGVVYDWLHHVAASL